MKKKLINPKTWFTMPETFVDLVISTIIIAVGYIIVVKLLALLAVFLMGIFYV